MPAAADFGPSGNGHSSGIAVNGGPLPIDDGPRIQTIRAATAMLAHGEDGAMSAPGTLRHDTHGVFADTEDGYRHTRAVQPQAPRLAHEEKAEIVDRLYEVALDPIGLEALVDVWEGRLGPLRGRLAEGASPIVDPEIEAHVGRAQVFLDRLDATRRDGGFRAVLDDIPRSAAFLSDGGPLIVACNRAACVAFGIAEGGPITALPFDPDEVETLRGIARKVASGKGERVVTLRIRSAITASPVIVRISPVESDAPRPLALVLSTELVWPLGFEDMVQDAFGLTVAETEIVQGITLGLPVRDIAEARGRSTETVRTQLRSILAKTETHSQSELVRVVLGLMDLASVPVEGAVPLPDPGTMERRPFRHLRLGDGRRLEWIEFGAPDGVPVVYMHLDYGLIRWPAKAERSAQARGLRVIVPVRAGYGASDLHMRGTDHLLSVTLDYAAVLDHLRVRAAAVISMGADLRYGMTLAAMRPGLVTGIVGCAAQLPLQTAAQYDRMDKWQRFILANARYAPRVLPFLVHAGFSLARKVGKASFFRQVNGASPADMAAFSDPDIREAVLQGSDVTMSRKVSAHEAFARECIGSERDWSAVVHACAVPVLLLQGDQDPQTPAQTIRELMDDFPHLEVRFVVDTGQLLFFAQWPLVLDELGRFLPK